MKNAIFGADKAMERARKRAMERKESDRCGNCFWFDGEEGDGTQFCDEKQREVSENGYCPMYKRRFGENESGDKVTWKSRAYEPEKSGEIIAMIPAGSRISPHIPETAKTGHIKVGGETSTYNRVLVAVPAGKNNQIIHYYAPTEKTVARQN